MATKTRREKQAEHARRARWRSQVDRAIARLVELSQSPDRPVDAKLPRLPRQLQVEFGVDTLKADELDAAVDAAIAKMESAIVTIHKVRI